MREAPFNGADWLTDGFLATTDKLIISGAAPMDGILAAATTTTPTYRPTSAMSVLGEPRCQRLRPGWARSGSSRRAPSSARMGRGDHHRGHHRYREGHFGRTYWQAPGWLEPQPTASPHRARRTSRPRLGCQPCANGGPRREEGCLLGYGPDREQPVAPESPPAIGPPAGGVAVTRRPSERVGIARLPWCPP